MSAEAEASRREQDNLRERVAGVAETLAACGSRKGRRPTLVRRWIRRWRLWRTRRSDGGAAPRGSEGGGARGAGPAGAGLAADAAAQGARRRSGRRRRRGRRGTRTRRAIGAGVSCRVDGVFGRVRFVCSIARGDPTARVRKDRTSR